MNIKKLNHIASKIFAVTALPQLIMLLFASCATDEVLTNNGEVPIRLSVACQPPTRGTSGASSQATTFDENAKINVTITTSDATPTYICNAAVFTVSAESEGKNSLTPPDVTRPPYYPNGDKTVSIKAFYPSTVSGTDPFAVQTDQTTVSDDETVDTYKLSDLMTASVTGQVKTTSSVNLEFHHRMAKINISATATDGLTIRSINLANVKTTASYASATDTWSGSGDADTIILAKNGTEATLSGVALFPAQTIEGKTFIQVVTDKGTANFAVTSKAFQEGYDYTASLEVGLQNLTMTSAITDWNAATGTATITKITKYGIYIDPISESFTYDGTAKTPSTVTVKYEKEGEDPMTLTEGTHYTLAYYNNTDVGEALIVASGKSGTDYAGSAAVQSYVIGQATPSVAFVTEGPVSREFAWNDSFTNDITDTSKYDGNTTWTSSDPDVAEVNGNGLITVVKPGTTVIKMSTDGSGNYKATSVQYTLTITKRSFKDHVSITGLGTYDATYNGTAKTPIPAVYDGVTILRRDDGHFTVNYSDNVNVGTATVTCTGGGIYYDNTTATRTFSINKVTPVITMDTETKTIGIGTTYECKAQTTYGTVVYSSSDATIASVNSSTGVVTALKARENDPVTITASVAAGDNWNAANEVTISIYVKSMETKFTAPGCVEYTCPATATYTFEVVGGSGGSYNGGSGGKGGIVKASVRLEEGEKVYVYVGGCGTSGNNASGGTNSTDSYGGKSGIDGGGSGGAASEIRIGGTASANRKLVAGGGGGSSGRRRDGRDAGASSSGNYSNSYGENATSTIMTVGGGGGGGYKGGRRGSYGGGYGGSNYIDPDWTTISDGTSSVNSNDNNGWVIISYEF